MRRNTNNTSRATVQPQRIGWALVCVLLAEVRAAEADMIPTLFNTGVDDHGVVLTTLTDGDHGIVDPHYSLVPAPGMPTGLEVYNYDLWLPGGPHSAWIAPQARAHGYGDNDAGPPGFYDYATTFDLTGLDPSTAAISGVWSADNQGFDILINGFCTGQQTLPNSFANALGTNPFSIASHFVPGINTLIFRVENSPGTPDYYNNPTGLRVEFLSAAADRLPPESTPTPEPTTLLLASIGTVCVALNRRRRREPTIQAVP